MIIYAPSEYFVQETEADRRSALSPILSRALRARGITTDAERQRFLYPDLSQLHDPFLLPDMDKAVERIEQAVFEGELICVYGDYDVDGICATAMLLQYLESIGAEVMYHIPSRHEEGYGISRGAVNRLKAKGVSLIITVDNGISAYREIEYAAELGIDTVVTDHHIPPENMPDCAAVVCHCVKESKYPYRYLCGAGIAFKLIQALGGLESALPYISLAGVATVADVVPMLDENRVLVKFALEAMNCGECCLGLSMLLDSLPTAKKPYNAYNIGFGVAPRLNASGRMGDASLGVELFITEDRERAAGIITELCRLNELRQAEEQSILDEAISMVEEQDLSKQRAILISSDKWNSGVIGIAASRLTELYHRPAILFSETDGVLKGSARSIDGVNIHACLKAHSDMFIRFGGHAKAAGVTMESSTFDSFVVAFNEYLSENCDADLFIPRRCYEFDEDISNITEELTRRLELLAPFGEGNPCPVFHASGVLPSHMRRFGCDGQHLRMDLRQNRFSFESVYFCGGKNFERIMSADSISLLYTPYINSWNGTDMVQLRVLSAKPDMPRCPSRLIKNNIFHFYNAYLHGLEYGEVGDLPPLLEADIVSAVRSSFAGMILMVSSTDTADAVLRKLISEGVENIELCFETLPNSNVCHNALLIAPNIELLPEKGYNTVIFCDEPYSRGCYAAIRERMPNARLWRMGEESDLSDLSSGFTISRNEFGEFYRSMLRLLSKRPYSMTELEVRLSEVLSRPPHQARFVLSVFVELGFISDKGNGVKVIGDGFRRLDESKLYRLVASGQQTE